MRNELSSFFDTMEILSGAARLTKNFTLGAMLYLIILLDDESMNGWIYKTLKDWRDDFGFITIWDKWRFDRLPYIEIKHAKVDGNWGTYYHLNRSKLDYAVAKLVNRS